MRSWTYCRSSTASRYCRSIALHRQAEVAHALAQFVRLGLQVAALHRHLRRREPGRHLAAAEAPERAELLERMVKGVQHALQLLADAAHADQGDERPQHVVGPFADHVDAGVAHHALVRLVGEVGLAAVRSGSCR